MSPQQNSRVKKEKCISLGGLGVPGISLAGNASGLVYGGVFEGSISMDAPLLKELIGNSSSSLSGGSDCMLDGVPVSNLVTYADKKGYYEYWEGFSTVPPNPTYLEELEFTCLRLQTSTSYSLYLYLEKEAKGDGLLFGPVLIQFPTSENYVLTYPTFQLSNSLVQATYQDTFGLQGMRKQFVDSEVKTEVYFWVEKDYPEKKIINDYLDISSPLSPLVYPPPSANILFF